jgi:hypothetical protein
MSTHGAQRSSAEHTTKIDAINVEWYFPLWR